jgi:hypothetical protein
MLDLTETTHWLEVSEGSNIFDKIAQTVASKAPTVSVYKQFKTVYMGLC